MALEIIVVEGEQVQRETAMRVAGGAVAKKILSMLDVDISAGVVQIGHIAAEKVSTLEAANNEFNFVDRKKIPDLEAFFNQLLKEQDSVGAKY